MNQPAMLKVLNSIARKIQRSHNMPDACLVAEFRRLAEACREPGDYEILKKAVDEIALEFTLLKSEAEMKKR